MATRSAELVIDVLQWFLMTMGAGTVALMVFGLTAARRNARARAKREAAYQRWLFARKPPGEQ